MTVGRKLPGLKKVVLAVLAGSLVLVGFASQPYGVTYVMSNSIAKGYYFSTKSQGNESVKPGEIVCVNIEQPDWIAERQYLPKDLPICKKVVAIQGDYVRLNGKDIELSKDGLIWTRLAMVQENDSKGRPVKVYPWGESTQLNQDEFFAFGDNNSMSLDSRYLGPMSTKNIEKTLKELYVYRSNIEQ